MYETLFQILELIQTETDQHRLAERLLERVVAFTEAERGFILVREGDSFEERYKIRYDREKLTAQQRRFSRSLVREAVRAREILHTADFADDTRFVDAESVALIGGDAILVAPVTRGDKVLAVIYLERPAEMGAFSEEARTFMAELTRAAGAALFRALEWAELTRFQREHARDLLAAHDFEGIVGRHPRMLALLETVAQVAASDAGVLIRGETGTGKELIAHAVHRNSPRKKASFVTLHCGALPETLFESELFGHKRGAFTGATVDRVGRIAQAHRGTLFIDEVAEIPLPAQAKLLRFLQSGEIQRVGSDRVEHLDVRVVAATHRDLAAMIEAGEFRQDLFYRLQVIELEIPPLRMRKSDIPLLVDHFLGVYWKREGPAPRLSPETAAILEAWSFPGNVCELAHLVERACVLAKGPHLTPDLLPGQIREIDAGPSVDAGLFSSYSNEELKAARETATKEAVDRVERAYLDGLLATTDGNIPEAAERAGMHRTYLYRLVAKHKKT